MDSVTDDMLILVSQKFENTIGCGWGMMTRMIKPMKFHTRSKLKDSSATDESLLLAPQESERNQGRYLMNDNKNNEINKSL